jgi:hypothetical protein
MPWLREAVRANRGFLARAVRFCAAQGVRQFLDLGCGLPSVATQHEVAHSLDPDSRVVYVDDEPVAVAFGERLLADVPNATIIRADLTRPQRVHGYLGWVPLGRITAMRATPARRWQRLAITLDGGQTVELQARGASHALAAAYHDTEHHH